MGASSAQMPDPPLAQPVLVALQGMEGAKPSTILSLSTAISALVTALQTHHNSRQLSESLYISHTHPVARR